MNKVSRWMSSLALGMAAATTPAHAGDLPVPAADQEALLQSPDPALAANKRLVYDMWRTIVIAGHVERVGEFIAPDYIQHNPTIANGRDAFVAFIKGKVPVPKPVPDKVTWPLLNVVAERDYVMIGFVRDIDKAKDPGKNSKTSWFDLFRVKDGRIIEHWDAATD